jgi:hypothetical protein
MSEETCYWKENDSKTRYYYIDKETKEVLGVVKRFGTMSYIGVESNSDNMYCISFLAGENIKNPTNMYDGLEAAKGATEVLVEENYV